MRNGFNLISGVVLLAIIVLVGLQLSTPVAAIPQDAVLAALSQAKPTIAEFGSDSCSTCKHMKQVLDQLQQRYADQVTVVHINIVKQPSYTCCFVDRGRILVVVASLARFYHIELNV